jgi:hypothetical protein
MCNYTLKINIRIEDDKKDLRSGKNDSTSQSSKSKRSMVKTTQKFISSAKRFGSWSKNVLLNKNIPEQKILPHPNMIQRKSDDFNNMIDNHINQVTSNNPYTDNRYVTNNIFICNNMGHMPQIHTMIKQSSSIVSKKTSKQSIKTSMTNPNLTNSLTNQNTIGTLIGNSMNKSLSDLSNRVYCRICYENEKDGGPILSPCQCQGSVKYIHEKCLKSWIESLKISPEESSCEICKYKFKIRHDYKQIYSQEQTCHFLEKLLTLAGISLIIIVVCCMVLYTIIIK